ncbi:MAG TPA: hypothetical protein PKK43_08790, partial [Spirochaetota bacterium]|nr:hypothetical protein [Spirochaetota bacterium]
MSKRVLDSKYPVVVYNPTGVFDIGYFKSCHAAGATPVFDCEFLSDEETLAGLKTLGESGFVFGIRVNGSRSVIMNFLRDNFFANLDCVVLYYDEGIPSAYSGSGIQSKIFLEVTEFHSHEQISLIDPLAVIVRGFEAGGRASRITSFILMQWYLENTRYPVVVHGGVGFHTAAGIFAAGCSAIVLDSQLYLSDESPVSENFKKLLQTVEEGDSSFIGESMRYTFRFFSKLGTKITKDLKEEESHLTPKSDGRELLYKSISSKIARLNDAS